MSPFRAPADDYVAVTSGEHLFDIEVEIGEGRDIQLEEPPRAVVASERSRKGVRFPRDLRVQSLDERLDIMRIPSSEDLAHDV